MQPLFMGQGDRGWLINKLQEKVKALKMAPAFTSMIYTV